MIINSKLIIKFHNLIIDNVKYIKGKQKKLVYDNDIPTCGFHTYKEH